MKDGFLGSGHGASEVGPHLGELVLGEVHLDLLLLVDAPEPDELELPVDDFDTYFLDEGDHVGLGESEEALDEVLLLEVDEVEASLVDGDDLGDFVRGGEVDADVLVDAALCT